MKIVLIEPRASEANVYSKIPMPLLGPIYLGTILKNRGHTVEIYKEDVSMPDYAKLDADLIGISILTSTARRGYEIAGKFPREKVIIGGIHASLLPQEAAQFCRQVIIGEAEDSIVDVVEGRNAQRFVYGQAVENLDRLPYPDFSLLKGFKYSSAIIPISTSRGCPFDCSFCSVTKIFGRKYRFRSAENVMQELESRKTNALFFCDDNFAAHPKRTYALLKFMQLNKIRNWACQVRCDAAKDGSLLDKMTAAGCKVVCVGFESINSRSLEAYEKKQSVGEIINSIQSFHKRRLKIHGMFVLGGDNDDRKTIWETVRFARRQKIDTLQMCVLTPFPGTKVYADLEREGRIFTKDWSLYDGQHIVFRPKLLSARELQVNLLRAYSKFYALSRSLSLFLRLHFRNALLNLMGCSVIREWKRANCKMAWLRV